MGLPPRRHEGENGLYLRRTASCYATCPISVDTCPPPSERGDAVEVLAHDAGLTVQRRSAATRRAGKSIWRIPLVNWGLWYSLSERGFSGRLSLPIGGHNPFRRLAQ